MTQSTAITCPRCNASRANLNVHTGADYRGTYRFIKCNACSHRIYEQETPQVEIEIEHVKHTGSVEICPGCNKKEIHTHINKLGLCNSCGKKLKSWQASKKTLPVPFIKIDGKWQPNPQKEYPSVKVEIVLTGTALCNVSHRLIVNQSEATAILKDPALISNKLEHHVGAYDVESWSGLAAVVQG